MSTTNSDTDLAQTSPRLPESKEVAHSSATAVESLDATEFGPTATKRLLRKIDLNLIPFLALIYLLCFLDRSNVGNARLVHLEADLHMKGLDYNIALAIFFPFYVAAEIPSNMMIKRFRPGLWIAFIMICWAIVMIFMGFVKNLAGLMAARVFLGIAEGGLFPGVSYYISQWYCRHECGFRIALFFSAATLAGAFGGLLARGIADMDGVGGRAAWSWIFILEGAFTLLVACTAYWIIPDYPATAKFLTKDEVIEVERRLEGDHNGLSNDFDMKFVFQALKDWKIYVHMFIFLGIFTPLYSIALFLPTIVSKLGYSNNAAQLMTVPPYVLACFITIFISWLADRARQRAIFMIGMEFCAIVGFILLISTDKPHIQYAGVFFAASGIYSLVPLATAWNANNIGGNLKRGVGLAMQVGMGNLGGCISAFVYRSTDAPRYLKGHSILIGTTFMSLILTIFMTIYYRHENSRRDRVAREQNVTADSYTEEMKHAERDMGDDATSWRFTP
ncbi:hypothetical protein BP5796_02176 [Coleophoma crateriformis]|uniref:Major facilitator superfamily (MFS) profile domain-containing protein n=1 Tax=Coleophoma crateriformis TaxID=565419 RepID=A0A3D8SXW5_9HELO|nr:hypothetical protein BP5796_02176 [Coleophoma crateriformis]